MNKNSKNFYASIYHPFGMVIEERSKSHQDYRFGFNGQEQDDEVSGNGNCLDFGGRIYNSRLGRWMAVDPKSSWYPAYSGYSYTAGSPTSLVDRDGEFIGTIIGTAVGGVIGGVSAAIKGDNVWKGIGKGAASGLVAGAVFDLTVATAGTGTVALVSAGALSGAAGNATDQGLNIIDGTKESFSAGEVLFSAALGGGLGYVGSKMSLGNLGAKLFKAGNVKNGASKAAGLSSGVYEFSQAEMKVVAEVEQMLTHKSMRVLEEAFEEGVEKSVKIFGRTIQYEPGIPPSTGIRAMTNASQNGFSLSSQAFQSREELTKTLLQEVYRLNNSSSIGRSLSGEVATFETRTTAKFVDDAFSSFFNSSYSSNSATSVSGAAAGASASGSGGGDILEEVNNEEDE